MLPIRLHGLFPNLELSTLAVTFTLDPHSKDVSFRSLMSKHLEFSAFLKETFFTGKWYVYSSPINSGGLEVLLIVPSYT